MTDLYYIKTAIVLQVFHDNYCYFARDLRNENINFFDCNNFSVLFTLYRSRVLYLPFIYYLISIVTVINFFFTVTIERKEEAMNFVIE